ncbi:hypothetical protein D9756_000952 [Leucocoprinus leucothites]|uniref:Uncharacterized protein n=1 Tax=Leucocoprinus leucothites TaxID=201217 RepID=A0A8H5GET9_9AGAR|nr:hypothetical protein D9756_000952 [Leucoagaricus leucothites]
MVEILERSVSDSDYVSKNLDLMPKCKIDTLELRAAYLKSIRPAIFGYCFDVLLYGFLTVQVYLYYLAFPNDKKVTKGSVYLVYAIGSIQTAFALRDFYELFCGVPGGLVQLEDLPGLHKFGFMWLTIPVSSALVAVTVQLFYAQRIWIILYSTRSVAVLVVIVSGRTSLPSAI